MPKINVALILADYKNIFQPYLTRLAEGLSNDYIAVDFFTFGSIPKDFPHKVTLLCAKSRVQKVWNILVLFWQSPISFLRFFLAKNSLSLRIKLKFWAEYGPLALKKYEYIHIANSFLFTKLELLTWAIQAPIIVSFRGHDTYIRPFIDPEWRKALLTMYEKASSLHFVSEAMKRFAIANGAPAEKSFVIYPGIDLRFYDKEKIQTQQNKSGVTRLITVGRFTWEKGVITALQAVRLLLNSGQLIHYSIIGGGPEEGEINFWIRKLSLESHVSLLGIVESTKVRELLGGSDIYIQSSLSEAFGVAVVEAMAMQLPVVCTDVGGLPEVVEDGVTGLIVPSADVNALARALATLCRNPEIRQQIGAAGRQRVVEKFSLDDEIIHWRKCYLNGNLQRK